MRAWIAALGLLVFASQLAAQPEGREEWRYRVNGYITSSSAAMNPAQTAIYVGVVRGGGGLLAALTPAGDRLWEFVRGEAIDATPLVGSDGTIYVGCIDSVFYALRPGVNEQRIKWSFRAGGFISSSAAMSPDGNTLYFGSGDGNLYAVSTNGERRWAFPTGNAIFSSPAVGGDGTIYFASHDRNVYAVAPDGTERWRVATGSVIYASPAIAADGTVYIGSNDQRFYAIRRDGTKRWEFFTNGVIDASAAIAADGTVYVPSSDGNFYAFNPGDNDEPRTKWIEPIGVTTASSPAVRGDGLVIFGADDNRVRALDPVTGKLRWSFNAEQAEQDDGIESSPLVAPDGFIYVGSLDGNLYKIRGNGSPLSDASNWPSYRRDVTRTGRAPRETGSGQLLNLSTRAEVTASQTLIVGFAVETPGVRVHLVRAVGPTLTGFGVTNALADPRLQLQPFGGSVPLAGGVNDNWSEPSPTAGFGIADAAAAVGAFPLPEGSRDAAVLLPLTSGLYTAHATSVDQRGGVVLVEVYDARAGNSARLLNVSTRSVAGTGDNSLIAGFVVGGSNPTRILLRGVGPGLTQFGVPNTLARPTLSLFSHATSTEPQRLMKSNSGWTTEGLSYDRSSLAARVNAFALPAGSADAAMVVTADPGAYTVQVSSANGVAGEALVEIYVLP